MKIGPLFLYIKNIDKCASCKHYYYNLSDIKCKKIDKVVYQDREQSECTMWEANDE